MSKFDERTPPAEREASQLVEQRPDTKSSGMTWQECRDLAAKLTDSGIPCFPIGIKFSHDKGKTEKRPTTEHGHLDATVDADKLTDLFARYVKLGPGEWPGVGAYPGPAGFLVLDVDDLGTLDALEAEHGEIIPGRRVRTASGGLHIWQRLPEGATVAQSSPWKGIDIRSSRGWVVAPGVSTPWGGWEAEGGKLADAPRWILDQLRTAETTRSAPLVETEGEKFGPGDRNEALFREARSMNRRGWTLEETIKALHIFNDAHCDPPHTSSEVERAARSAYERYEQGRPQPNGKQATEPSAFRLVDPATIEPEAMRWAWHHRIATGTLTILAGRGGIGKGALWVDLTAKLTRGTLEGDLHGDPVSVLVLTAEERIADVVGPRLRVAGADLSRVRVMTMLEDDYDRDATFPQDLPAVREAIEEIDARLVVVDPLNAHLADSIDSHKDAPLRRALGPLTRLAGETDAAVLGVAHVNKGSGDAVDRVLGSVGYVNAARGLLIVGPPPDADEGTPERVVALPKANNTAPVPSLRFELEGRTIEGVQADGTRGDIEVVGITWKGEDSASAEDLLGTAEDRSALGEAVAWLQHELADGPKEKRDLFKAARADGLAERTLHRARKHLRVDVYRDETKQGRPSTWMLAGYVPSTLDREPLARNLQGSDQGKQSESGGFMPTTESGTKPCEGCGLDPPRHGSVCRFREPTPDEIAP